MRTPPVPQNSFPDEIDVFLRRAGIFPDRVKKQGFVQHLIGLPRIVDGPVRESRYLVKPCDRDIIRQCKNAGQQTDVPENDKQANAAPDKHLPHGKIKPERQPAPTQ